MKKIINAKFVSNANKLDESEMKLIVGGCAWLYKPSWMSMGCNCNEDRSEFDNGGGSPNAYTIVCANGYTTTSHTCRYAETVCYGMEYGCYP